MLLPYHTFLAPHSLILGAMATLSPGLHTTPLPVIHAGIGNLWKYKGLNHSFNERLIVELSTSCRTYDRVL